MTGVLRAIVNVVSAGQRYAENVYKFLDGVIKSIISYLQSTQSTKEEKKEEEKKGRVFIIF